MPQFERHFTLDEAQSLVPWVRGVFKAIHEVIRIARRDVLPQSSAHTAPGSKQMQFEGDTLSAGAFEQHPNAFARALAQVPFLSMDEKQKLLQGLVDALTAKGIVIQDVQRGLIDFPSWRDGEEVLLCYELRDGDHIGFWHPVDAGFAGRRPIEGADQWLE